MKKIFLVSFFALFVSPVFAAQLFDEKEPIQGGMQVFEVSSVFADIYEKLDTVKWSGKSVSIAIEGLEKIDPKAHIAATDERVVLVWGDSIVANYPRPAPRDWDGFGQITTALVLKMRELSPSFGKMGQSEMYQTVVSSLLANIDENGRYVYSKKAEALEDGRILTSIGLEGGRDERGNFRIQGVYKDSPADNDGIKAGDLISQINGVPVSQISDADLSDSISGFNSGTLKFTLLTPLGDKNIVLRRATIVLADADIIFRSSGEKEGLLEIVVHKITDNSVSIVNEALAKYNGDANGIILDLRATGGDDEIAAAKMAGLFIGQKPIMRIVETAKTESEIVPGGNAVTNVPMVVLISNTTRGTAEAIAAAFYENNRGVIIGTPTAGDAKIASVIDLKNGGALELFNKSVKTGIGRDINGRGVFPLVCLSNIRNTSQQGAFFLNVINDDFRAQDFNSKTDVPTDKIRKGCPSITSGADEDAAATAVSVKILTDSKIYNKLINK